MYFFVGMDVVVIDDVFGGVVGEIGVVVVFGDVLGVCFIVLVGLKMGIDGLILYIV